MIVVGLIGGLIGSALFVIGRRRARDRRLINQRFHDWCER